MVGKRVHGALYVHRSCVTRLSDEHRSRVSEAVALAPTAEWNVVRIEPATVGLLEYEDFDASAFPALRQATRVELDTKRVGHRSHVLTGNPLILHRKELLVDPADVRAVRWREMTEKLQKLGLFRDSHLIGRRRQWNDRLAQAGYVTHGDTLCRT